MNSPFHVTVAAVIEQDGRYLMVEEMIKSEQVYNQPAGHLEPGESLLEAVVREVMEETAHPFTPQALVGIYRWQHPDSGETFVRFCFRGEVGEAQPDRNLDKEILRAVWMTEDELQACETRLRSPLVLECLRDARRGVSYPLEMLRDMP